jgi:GNAT superfamily N-acetyltransferase
MASAAQGARPPVTDAVSIRQAKDGEEPEICALVERIFDEFVAPEFPREGVDEFLGYAHPDAMARRRATGQTILVAEQDDRIVGMLELRGFAHIAMLFVGSHGRGVGRALFEEALRICRDHPEGTGEIRVHASRYAVPIYQRLGFAAEGPEQTEHGITYVPMLFHYEAGG